MKMALHLAGDLRGSGSRYGRARQGKAWRGAGLLAALWLAGLLASCGQMVPKAGQSPAAGAPAKAQSAVLAGVRAGPPIAALDLTPQRATAAMASFRESCPSLLARKDVSGLTDAEDWQQACAAADGWPPARAVAFFSQYFEAIEVGDGKAFATGYFEPEIAGSATHLPGYDVPVYALPADLVRARPGDAEPLADGRMPLGRYDAQGRFGSYFDRAQIENGALDGRGLAIAWVKDPVALFFLQVQGSGRLRAPDGTVMRIGYAGQNGLPYTAIGAIMARQGLIGSGAGQYPASMQGIVRYIHEHPQAGRALMLQNRSYIFFRELTGDGPLGAMGVAVRGGVSVAADPRFVPLGAPVWLDLDRRDASGLWVAQDTGGAIRGANRFDTFWGAGAAAAQVAGGMRGRGRALVLVPLGTLARLRAVEPLQHGSETGRGAQAQTGAM